MNLQTFLPYIPFLAVLYAVFALVQALRHQRQGFVATLLALVSFAAPLIAYVFSSDVTVRASLILYMALNAAIVFVVSLLTLLIERRNAKRDPNHSYGMLGLGLSILLAVGMFALPLLATTSSAAPAVANTINNASNGQTVLVSTQTTSTVPLNTASDTSAQPEATQSADSTPTAVAQALTAQTGLSADDILTKIQAGSTIADLVTANNGSLDPVVTAIAKALDDLVAAGGRQAQMISNFGSDTTAIANQLVQGTLGQGQNFLLPQLITGSMPTPPNGAGGAPPSGNPPSNTSSTTSNSANTTDSSATSVTPVVTASPVDTTASPLKATAEATSEAVTEANSVPAPVTTEDTSIIKPTRIVFPTDTPTPDATDEAAAESTAEATSASEAAANAVTCTLIVDYNLNLRDKPSSDGSSVLLTIPFGTTVTTDGKTSDDWYRVSYEGKSGWVSGQYVTASASCTALTVLAAS